VRYEFRDPKSVVGAGDALRHGEGRDAVDKNVRGDSIPELG
jgi:hypothetical protein